ncbi:hypothetical protein Dimus_006313 [Dionaea muscipula]
MSAKALKATHSPLARLLDPGTSCSKSIQMKEHKKPSTPYKIIRTAPQNCTNSAKKGTPAWFQPSIAFTLSRRDWLICEIGGSLNDESSSISHLMISSGMADQVSTPSMMKIMRNRLRTIRSFVAIPDDTLMRSKIRAGTTIKRDWSTDVPDVIGELKHLRYLDLSRNPFEELQSPLLTLY